MDNVIQQKITLENFISEGTYGKVYKGRVIKTEEIVAVKEIKIDLETEGISSTSLREIAILSELRHPNIVQLKEVICDDMKLYLIFDFLDIDLKKYLEEVVPKDKFLDPNDIRMILFQMLEGVKYCHAKKILHRDLKPQNILVKISDGTIKLADFGLARVFSIPSRPYTKEVLTLWYRSPELLMGLEEYGEFVDIWAIGCIFAEIVSKKALFPGDNELDQLNKIFKLMGNPDPDIYSDLKMNTTTNFFQNNYQATDIRKSIPQLDNDGINLLNQMLEYNPKKRITAVDALLHVSLKGVIYQPYFSNLHQLKNGITK